VRVPPIDVQAIESQSYGEADCSRAPATKCIVVHGSGTRILLIGDSHALGLVPAFAGLARKRDLTFAVATFPNCPWQHGLVETPPNAQTDVPQKCRARQDDWYRRLVPQLDPDVVVLVHHPFDDPNGAPDMRAAGKLIHPGTPTFEKAIRVAARQTIEQLRKVGRKIVILEPLPLAPAGFNPLTCLSQAKYVDDCRYVASATPTPLESYYRSIGNGTDIFTLDLDRLVCPYLPICDPIVRGIVVKSDAQHITAAYSKTLVISIGTLLLADGIIPRTPRPAKN
jgi:hypothetical protein